MYPDIVGENANGQPVGLPPGTSVVDTPRVARTLYASAPAAAVAANTTVDFAVTVQVPMRLDQLVIVDETNALTVLRVTRIAVGPNNQIVSNGGSLPARMFAPESFQTNQLQGNTAKPGVDVIVSVFNPGGQPATVSLGIKGVALTG